MALNFIYKKYKDVYIITNTGIDAINYTVTRRECNSNITVKSGVLLAGEVYILPLHFVDGLYEVVLTDTVQSGETIETETISNILYYNSLLSTIIDNIEESICGCKKCKECEECNDCQTYLNTINQVLAFTYVNHPVYNNYLNIIANKLKCNYTELISCMIINKNVLGNEDTKNIFLQIIAMHYLAFYMFDLSQALDASEGEYIKLKYKSAKILKCIKKLGIDVDDILNLFTGSINVFYWQIPDLFQDITNIIPIFNNSYLVGKTQAPFEEFEQGKTITYSTVGRIAFALQQTDILSFFLSDALGNDITDEFEKEYFPATKTVLYVSKMPYSNSNIFFKFKKITFLP